MEAPVNPARTERLLLTAVAVVAVAIRLHQLDADSFFMDEIHQALYYQESIFKAVIGAIMTQQPPLDYVIGRLVYLVDSSDFALRLPAALFGAGSAMLVTMLCLRMLRELSPDTKSYLGTSLLVGILAATMPYAIYISQDIRPYSSAIFFFLLLLLVYQRLMETDSPGAKEYAVLGLCTLAFLLSRTLSPLVVCLVLGAALFLPWASNLRTHGVAGTADQKRRLFAQLAMLAALALYSPLLIAIILRGQSFLNSTGGDGNGWPLHSIGTAWKVQMAPFSVAFLAIPALGVIAAVRSPRPWFQLPKLIPILLLAASVIHFLIFHSLTTHPFRPPYSIYIYPLLLLLSGLCFQLLTDRLSTSALTPAIQRLLMAAATGILLLLTANATLEFKQRDIKTDWREFSNYVKKIDNSDRLWISYTPAEGDVWQPGFFGFYRYPVKSVMASSITEINEDQETRVTLAGIKRKPVLLLFVYRDYMLTKASPPLMPIPPPAGIHVGEMVVPEEILLKEFTGLKILSLREDLHDTSLELLVLLNYLLEANHQAPYLQALMTTQALLSNQQDTP
jgi:hypothetical protein